MLRAVAGTCVLLGACALCAGTVTFHRSFRNGFPEPWHVTKAEAGFGQSYRNYAAFEGRVVQVVDGDTLRVHDPLHRLQHTVRLANIDAPELAQPFGSESRQHLEDLIAGRSVTVSWTARDANGRLLGTIRIESFVEKGARPKPPLNVNLQMVKDGYAWASQGTRTPEYAGGMRTAKAARRGLWHARAPQAPWLFRQTVAAQTPKKNEVKK